MLVESTKASGSGKAGGGEGGSGESGGSGGESGEHACEYWNSQPVSYQRHTPASLKSTTQSSLPMSPGCPVPQSVKPTAEPSRHRHWPSFIESDAPIHTKKPALDVRAALKAA